MKKVVWVLFWLFTITTAIAAGLCYIYIGMIPLSIAMVIATIISPTFYFPLGLLFYWLFCLGLVVFLIFVQPRLRNQTTYFAYP